MKMKTIIGGVASSAVIGAMAVIYMTASEEAYAAVDPTEPASWSSDYDPERMLALEPQLASSVAESVVRPRPRPDWFGRLPESVTDSNEQYCLAQNVYFEARGEGRIGQEAVAWVTLNRVTDPRWPNSICRVVWQTSQFSWTHDGRSDRPRAGQMWDQAQEIAARVTASYDPALDPTEGSVMFHADYVNPGWSRRFARVVQIDAHIFYR
jgi:spore germination cell wall hydrolase CwlJ-like protein